MGSKRKKKCRRTHLHAGVVSRLRRSGHRWLERFVRSFLKQPALRFRTKSENGFLPRRTGSGETSRRISFSPSRSLFFFSSPRSRFLHGACQLLDFQDSKILEIFEVFQLREEPINRRRLCGMYRKVGCESYCTRFSPLVAVESSAF